MGKTALLLILLSCFVATGCSTAGKMTDQTAASAEEDLLDDPLKGLDAIPVIDAHTHTDFDGTVDESSGLAYSEEEYLKEFREANVVGAVSHSSRRGTVSKAPKGAKVVRCLAAIPKHSFAQAEKYIREGTFQCFKVYLGYEHRWANDPFYRKFYDLARKYKVPVVLHTGDTYDIDGKLKYADPLTIDEIAVDYRDVTFVIAHLGNPWIQSAAEVVYKNPNVYADISALLIGDFKSIPPQDVHEFVEKPITWAFGYAESPAKLMFATDWPLVRIKDYKEAVARAIPKEHWKAVFHDNAYKVFGFDKPSPALNLGLKKVLNRGDGGLDGTVHKALGSNADVLSGKK